MKQFSGRDNNNTFVQSYILIVANNLTLLYTKSANIHKDGITPNYEHFLHYLQSLVYEVCD